MLHPPVRFSHRMRANNLQKSAKMCKNANAVENNLPVNEAARILGPAKTNNDSILLGFWFYIVCLLLKEDAGGDRRQNMGQSISKIRACIFKKCRISELFCWGRIERSTERNLWQKSLSNDSRDLQQWSFLSSRGAWKIWSLFKVEHIRSAQASCDQTQHAIDFEIGGKSTKRPQLLILHIVDFGTKCSSEMKLLQMFKQIEKYQPINVNRPMMSLKRFLFLNQTNNKVLFSITDDRQSGPAPKV